MEDKVNLADFDPVAYTLERYKSAPLKLTYQGVQSQRSGEPGRRSCEPGWWNLSAAFQRSARR